MLYTRLFGEVVPDFAKDYDVSKMVFIATLVLALKQMTNLKKLFDEEGEIFDANNYIEKYDMEYKKGNHHKPYFNMSLEEKIEHDMDFIHIITIAFIYLSCIFFYFFVYFF